MPAPRTYALAIFDFDGTLADSAEWFGSVINGVARRYRFREASRAELEAMRGTAPAEVMRRLGLARWKLPFVVRHLRRLMARDIAEIRLFPGIERMLRELHATGVRLAVVSSNTESNIRTVLGAETARLVDLFACGAALEGKAAKFRGVLKRARVEPADALAIGDEVSDIDAAEIVGVAAGAVTWGYAPPDVLKARRPTVVFERVDDILPFATAHAELDRGPAGATVSLTRPPLPPEARPNDADPRETPP